MPAIWHEFLTIMLHLAESIDAWSYSKVNECSIRGISTCGLYHVLHICMHVNNHTVGKMCEVKFVNHQFFYPALIYYKQEREKGLRFTGFDPNVRKPFARFASSVLKELKKAIA